jgi:hypothetical protein
MIDNRFHE